MEQNIHILWISPEKEKIEQDMRLLAELGYIVSHSCSADGWQNNHSQRKPDIVIVSHQESAKKSILTCLSIETEIINDSEKKSHLHNVYKLLIVDEISLEEKETYFQHGGNDLIIQPFGHDELLSVCSAYCQQKLDHDNLISEVAKVNDVANKAMSHSNNLDSIINFVKNAITAKTYQELATCLFDEISRYSEASLIEIKSHNNVYSFCSLNEEYSDLQSIMLNLKSSKRLIREGDVIQINHGNLVILVLGLPVDDISKIGHITENLVMICDVADRFVQGLVAEERIQQAEKAKRQFLKTLSHELRTPLNSMLGFSHVLAEKRCDQPVGEDGLKALQHIINHTNDVNRIIKTLMEITQVSTELKSYPVIDLTRFSTLLSNEFSHQSQQKGLTFSVLLDKSISSIPPMFQCDVKKVFSMISHLVQNAIKFTEKGHIKVVINKQTSTEGDEYICFEVTDTGIGIDESHHESIFLEIGQLNKDNARGHYGLGMGLYYVYHICNQLQGKVSVQSHLGQGATFTLLLPLKKSNVLQ